MSTIEFSPFKKHFYLLVERILLPIWHIRVNANSILGSDNLLLLGITICNSDNSFRGKKIDFIIGFRPKFYCIKSCESNVISINQVSLVCMLGGGI